MLNNRYKCTVEIDKVSKDFAKKMRVLQIKVKKNFILILGPRLGSQNITRLRGALSERSIF